MAMKNVAFGSSNDNKQVDLIDIGALVLLPMFASLIFGVFTWQVTVFGGFDFTQPLWTILGADVSVSLIVSVSCIAWIVMTNLFNQQTDMTRGEVAAVGTALALPVLFVVMPAVQNLVSWHDLIRLAAWLYVSCAAVYVSYMG